jgi:hypothetical protein
LISDSSITLQTTWSSDKINTALINKSELTHNHAGIYEPSFNKNTAFNKPFEGAGGYSGTADNLSRGDHGHADLEPLIGAKYTAFNQSFGTTSGTVAYGDHKHDGVGGYMPWVFALTAYNRNFVQNIEVPLPEEIPRGNHFHRAAGVTYDPTGNVTVTSGDVQAAIHQLDSAFANVEVSENSYLTAGTSSQYERTIAGTNTPVPLRAPLAVLSLRNATLTDGSSIIIGFADVPNKKIEGFINVTITFSSSDNTALYIAIDDVIQGESVHGSNGVLTINKYLANLDENGFKITPYVANLDNTNNIFIESMSVSWEGNAQGALVLSGTSVAHGDTTGRNALDQHTIGSITGLQADLDTKAAKAQVIVANNFTLMDSNGDLVNSGMDLNFANNLIDKISPVSPDNITVQDTDGSIKDGGLKISDLALIAGSATQSFNVAVATADEHAVRNKTFTDVVTALATKTELTDHTSNISNPHSVTHIQVGAAATAHTHIINEVSGLQGELDDKYAKVAGQGTDNLPVFGNSSTFSDSLISINGKLLIGEAV